MIWRHPLAWIGLATLLVPIAIHLLVRQQAQPQPFPSLRFVKASRLAAIKRRRLNDLLLLALRLLILAAAVAALADPFFASDRRRADWARRTARAIIVDTPAGASTADAAPATPSTSANASPGGAPAPVRVDAVNGAILDPALAAAAQAEAASAFASTVLATSDLQGGVTHALAWLASAPPAAREIVIVSPLTRGRVSDAVGAQLPPHVGLRFARAGATAEQRRVEGRPASMRAGAASGADTFATRTPGVTAYVDRTEVQWRDAGAAAGLASTATRASAGSSAQSTAPPVAAAAPAQANGSTPGTFAIAAEPTALVVSALGLRVEAAPRDLPAARAALDAVLSEGVPLAGQSSRPLIVAIGEAARTRESAADERGSAGVPTRTLTAPWMAEALRTIATDHQLGDAVFASAPRTSRGNAAGEAASDETQSVTGASSDTTTPKHDTARDAPSAASLVLLRASDGQPLVTAHALRNARQSVAARSDAAAVAQSSGASSSSTPSADASSSNAAPPDPRADDDDAALLITSRAAADSDVTALLLRAALRATADADPLPRAEVARIPEAQLAAWQRPAGLPPMAELTRVESHDRRWFWGAALLLLLAERIVRWRMRRREPESPEVAHAA